MMSETTDELREEIQVETLLCFIQTRKACIIAVQLAVHLKVICSFELLEAMTL